MEDFTMRQIGFIGLGTMGGPMAENLLRKGYEVTVYNRSRAKAEALVSLGAKVADTPAQVAKTASILFTMLGDDTSVESIYYDADGLLSGAQAGAMMIDCSTVSPALSRRLAQDLAQEQVSFLDAPVTGSKPAAINGTLLFMVGGEAETLSAAQDVFLAMGREIVHMGPSGMGSQTKLAHNAMVGIHAAALAEGLSLALKAGLDPAKFLSVVQSGGAASKQVELKRDKLLQRDFSNQFSLKLMLKDLRLASEMAAHHQVPTPMLAETQTLFQMGQTQGLGELDLCSIIQLYEQWTGVKVGDK
jgi:3-hydroxyisobutyrate dehydrogenase-like beta-hydroxyacid dehydrogenase